MVPQIGYGVDGALLYQPRQFASASRTTNWPQIGGCPFGIQFGAHDDFRLHPHEIGRQRRNAQLILAIRHAFEQEKSVIFAARRFHHTASLIDQLNINAAQRTSAFAQQRARNLACRHQRQIDD